MKTTLTLTCAVFLLSICQGAVRREVDSCEMMLMNAEDTLTKQEGQTICQYNQNGLAAYNQALSSCQDTSTTLIQEWVMTAIFDMELAETKQANCDIDTTVLHPFLSTENKAKVVEANQHLEDIPSEMLKCMHDTTEEMEKDMITAYLQHKDGHCIAGIGSWSSMAYKVVKCTKAAGATVSCKDELGLYQLGDLNIHLYTQLITDFPEKCN
ncbi:unnamed protein product [Owenia fusiformis]|uniref:Uncharacterized protein n=1 Tax=Owenia fusiformis TaxID=6347 RepID=A0A8S4PEC3_OWEFU|nr:unnamed protein product [Owenia fusiformis]